MSYINYPTNKVNGASLPGDHVTGKFDSFLVRTTVNITPSGLETDPNQDAFDKLIQVINLRAQPVVLNNVDNDIENTGSTGNNGKPQDLTLLADGITAFANGTTVYHFYFIIEHDQAWGTDGTALAAAINGIALDAEHVFVSNGVNQNISFTVNTDYSYFK